MLSAFQLRQLNSCITLHVHPLAAVDLIAQRAVNIIACSIQQMEPQGVRLLHEDLFGKVDGKGRLAIAEGQRQLSLMGLAGGIGHIGHDHKIIELGILALRQHHRHAHLEVAVGIGHRLLGQHLHGIFALTDEAALPIAIVGHPPPGHATLHTIADAGTLYGHAGIAEGSGTHGERVAVVIVLFHLGELHLERGTLIFLHTEIVGLSVKINGVMARQSLCRKHELGTHHAILVGHQFLRSHLLIVGIAQRGPDRLACHHLMFEAMTDGIENGRHLHLLAGTVDGTVGIDGCLPDLAVVVVIIEIAAPVVSRTGTVGSGRRIGLCHTVLTLIV